MKVVRKVAAGVTSLGLVLGMTGVASAMSGSNTGTGPDSYNSVRNRTHTSARVTNNNDVSAANTNHQSAYTGQAGVYHNTTGGGASTGSAANANSLSASVNVNNNGAVNAAANATSTAPAGSQSGTNSNTGPDSTNVVRNTVDTHVSVTNNNDLHVYNTNSQTAMSGSATVAGNTTGGSATTGNASNTNSSTMNFTVSN